jgi:acetyltransferase-like isoleucine patch superfamily enzyme
MTFGHLLAGIRNKIYSCFIRRQFKEIGDSHFFWHAYNIKGGEYIHIGNDCIFESGLQLTAWKVGEREPQISIGNNCLFRRDTHITACNKIIIGNNLLTGTNIFITDNSHGTIDGDSLKMPPRLRPIVSKGPVIIGNNVWLGNNVCIMPGVTIGDGAVIGANAVVTHDIPAFCVAAGVPAKIIKQV